MANTFNAGVYTEAYEIKLQERLNKPTTWKDVCDVIYSDVKIFNMPYMSTEFSLQSGTRGTAYSHSDFALTNDTIDIATHEIVSILQDRADFAQCQYVTQMEIAERAGQLCAAKIETVFLADHGEWTNAGDSAGVVTSGVSTTFTVQATNIDDIVRDARSIIIAADGKEIMDRDGLAFVWRAADYKLLEQYAQNNGFQLADYALKNGIPNAYFFLGAYHYVSNSHAANHVFFGVRKVVKIGLLRSTWGKLFFNPNAVNADGPVSAVSWEQRVDWDVMTPNGLATLVYDFNVV